MPLVDMIVIVSKYPAKINKIKQMKVNCAIIVEQP